MLLRRFIILLCCCFVYHVFAVSTFIDQGKRAELFEITEYTMPNLKIYMPDEEFIKFKNAFVHEHHNKFSVVMESMKSFIKSYFIHFKTINFKDFFPYDHFEEILPELKIGEDGFPGYAIEDVLNGFDFNPEHYNINLNEEEVAQYVMESNPYYNINRIVEVVFSLELASHHNLEELYYLMFPITDEEEEEEEEDSIAIESPTTETSELFKTKKAKMIFELNGEQNLFDKITFKIGGNYSRSFQKPGYNLKIRGEKDLYGRSQFKLRADSNDPTMMRTKLISDIHNRLGLPSVSSTYVQLYINDEFMGLYTFNDAYKVSWIEKVYGEKEAKNLYKCDTMEDLLPKYFDGCTNENEEERNNTSEWIEFLTAVEHATSAADLEAIFEIDHFLYEMAIDYLTGAYDHIQNRHNYYMYKQPNGKWIYLSHDFDHDFGQMSYFFNAPVTTTLRKINLLKILIFRDTTRFEEILSDVVQRVFHPAILFPYIDGIKTYIKPFVIKDKTPDAKGYYPGHLNTDGIDKNFTLEQWDAYSEFTNGYSDTESYGLKYWILMRYRFVCDYYQLECDATYLDENYKFPVVTELDVDYNELILLDKPLDDEEPLTYYSSEIPTKTFFEIVPETQTQTIDTITTTTTTVESTPTKIIVDLLDDDITTTTVESTPTEIIVDLLDDAVTKIEENDESNTEEEEEEDHATSTINEIKTITKTIVMIQSTILN
ncbi:coth-domain-containing protein [Piromyces finnis]|uniref:Coth-domain-containing protein n=1 Tax=Piromyces finnis TaxID=1754191 RepID=A0A1Y1UX65_9FUNG|nr:coth-domain-containing protein [Piromyces finnis]|eukprot:ORX42709.1 coth-domain-containing protein [Piromyces finnis]